MRHADRSLAWLGSSEKIGFISMRIAIAVVFLWIGAIKFLPYEADSITPFVANNPIMSLFYREPEHYKAHLTREGELIQAQREWQRNNNTYLFSNWLGAVEIAIGLLALSGIWFEIPGALGAVLAFLTSFVTLSFLITTSEAWVAALGDKYHGFPFLSGAGRLVLKDVMLWAGGLLLIIDSASALRAKYAAILIGSEAKGETRTPRAKNSIRNIGVGVILAFAVVGTMGWLSPAWADEIKPAGDSRSASKSAELELSNASFFQENYLAMAKMMKGMTLDSSGDIDVDFASLMIPQHQGAIDIAMAELRHGTDERMREIARKILAQQTETIALLHQGLFLKMEQSK